MKHIIAFIINATIVFILNPLSEASPIGEKIIYIDTITNIIKPLALNLLSHGFISTICFSSKWNSSFVGYIFPIIYIIKQDIIKELTVDIDNDRVELYNPLIHLNNTEINVFKTSHDAKGSVAFLITEDNNSLVYITDTGYLNRKYFPLLENKNIYYIESNHDEKMLMDGPYPYYLKQRIISDEGHLSNDTTAKYLKKLVGDNTKYKILAHLSEHNNKEEIAYNTSRESLKDRSDIKIVVAKQSEALEEVEVYNEVNMCR